MNKEIYEGLLACLSSEKVKMGELMARHTTFRIGGPADFFVLPENVQEVQNVIGFLKEKGQPYYILGNGSNLLVSDKGYRGTIVCLSRMNGIEEKDGAILAQAGALMSKIAAKALENSMAGFEFASGIPGSVGGAVVMNAGAYGGEMKDVIEEVTVLNEENEIVTMRNEELEFGYRTSVVMKRGYTVLSVKIRLEKGEKEKIKAFMDELKERRTSKQPLEYPSAGSTFKRPEGYFAGKLIQDSGLSGFRVGGARISEKHSGFVINGGDATAEDVNSLMQQVSDKVYEKFGVRLEPEVKRLGEF